MKRFQQLNNAPPKNLPEEKLEGYIKVPKEEWSGIPIGSHVRYLSLNDEFRTGGFVERFGEKNGEKYVVLRPGVTRDIKTFVVYFRKVKTFWKKIDRSSYNEFSMLQKQIWIMDNFLQFKFGDDYRKYIRERIQSGN